MSESQAGRMPRTVLPFPPQGLSVFLLPVGCDVTPATPAPAVSRLDRCWPSPGLSTPSLVTYRFPSEIQMALPDARPPLAPVSASWPTDRQP